MAWSRRFDDPIALPDGRTLEALRDAAGDITRLSAKKAELEHWQLAMQLLIEAADRGGIVMMARIAVLRALNHGNPDPKTAPRSRRAKTYRIIR
jgi:hypothetical protein